LPCFVIGLRSQTPKHIRGGWSHYTDTSEPVDGRVGTRVVWHALGFFVSCQVIRNTSLKKKSSAASDSVQSNGMAFLVEAEV
jgi:hypothetical protein